ncbi:serine hydrolase domain-containing protein [Ekhidna sp.]
MKFPFQYVILAIFIVSCTSSQTNEEYSNPTDDYSMRIDSLIETTNPRSFNGVILITQDGAIKYSKAYGYSDYEKKTPISLNDNFRIQSNSKQITSVLALKEIEKGNLMLDATIKTYLVDFEQPWADSVTVHHLLNMSSGIQGVDKPLAFPPGTAYKYSNSAYGILGAILEQVSGKSYIELANNLFLELGMKNTYCYELGKENPSLINGYRVANEKLNLVVFDRLPITKESWKPFIPAGGIISNVYDLNLWDTQLHTGKILKPESYQRMINYSITGQHDAFGDEEIGYGYGLRIHDKGPTKHMGHAGRGIGFAGTKFYIPEKGVDVIVLENVYNEDTEIIYHFEKEIRNIVLSSSLVK